MSENKQGKLLTEQHKRAFKAEPLSNLHTIQGAEISETITNKYKRLNLWR